jgi:hypothetical protein
MEQGWRFRRAVRLLTMAIFAAQSSGTSECTGRPFVDACTAASDICRVAGRGGEADLTTVLDETVGIYPGRR